MESIHPGPSVGTDGDAKSRDASAPRPTHRASQTVGVKTVGVKVVGVAIGPLLAVCAAAALTVGGEGVRAVAIFVFLLGVGITSSSDRGASE
jgi:hypothetical protein